MSACKVLLVDDDARLRGGLRLLLELRGHMVSEASTGAEALTLAESHLPDLILLDLGLPDGDGLDVAQELRRRPAMSGIGIAIITGEHLGGHRAQLAASVSMATIQKPVTFERLDRDLQLLLTARRRPARCFPRYRVEATVCWRPREGGGADQPAYAPAVARTFSEGGLMLELPRPLPVASLIDLQVLLPAGLVAVAGKIVWVRSCSGGETEGGPYQHGVQFIAMGPATRAAIQQVIARIGRLPQAES